MIFKGCGIRNILFMAKKSKGLEMSRERTIAQAAGCS